jgi:hypothetical protein
MTWWLVVLLLLAATMLEREVVILVFLVVVPIMLIREAVPLAKRRARPSIHRESHAEPNPRSIGRLRFLAWVAVAAAVGQHAAYQFGWTHDWTRSITTGLLVLALALTLAARRFGSLPSQGARQQKDR